MREPFETLLGQYRDHWLLAPYLQGDTPDFVGIVTSDPIGRLSNGETIMLHVALAVWNGDTTARIAHLAELDETNRRRVVDALALACDLV